MWCRCVLVQFGHSLVQFGHSLALRVFVAVSPPAPARIRFALDLSCTLVKTLPASLFVCSLPTYTRTWIFPSDFVHNFEFNAFLRRFKGTKRQFLHPSLCATISSVF